MFKHFLSSLIKKIIVFFIVLYQKTISPDHSILGSFYLPYVRCKFYPSCSEYTKQAIMEYNIQKGMLVSIKRIMKCRPKNNGGYDPVKII